MRRNQLGDGLADERHACGTADQDDAVDLVGVQPGIAQGAFERLAQAGQQGLGGFVKFVAGNDGGNDAAADINRDFGQHFFAQFPFCGFQSLPQFAAVAQFGAFGIAQFFALAQEALAQYLYEVFAAQMVVARTGGYLHHAVEIVQNGYVERAPPKS